MEPGPCLYMVDCLGKEEPEVFEGKKSNLYKIKKDCLGLNYFWCKQVVIDGTEEAFNNRQVVTSIIRFL